MCIPLPGKVDRFWLKLGQGMYFSWDFENWPLTSLKLRWKTSLSETPTCHLLDSQSNLFLPLTSPGLLIPYWSPVGILPACFHEPEQISLARTSSTGPWFVHTHTRVNGESTHYFTDGVKNTSPALPEGLNPSIQELLVVGLRKGSSLRTKVPFHLIH